MTDKEIKNIGIKVITDEIEALVHMKKMLSQNKGFVEAVKSIYKCKGKVIIMGMGKSGLIGQKIAATLTSTGTPAFFLNPAEGSHGDLGLILKDDIVILLSKSGETEEIIKLIPYFKRFAIKLILITSRPDSIIGKHSDIIINVDIDKEACPLNLAPTSSTTAQLVVGDAIAVALLKLKGFTKEDFALYHPGGLLSKKLLKVEDLMHSGEELPVVNVKDKMRNVISTIIDKKLGVAIVVDNNYYLKGIIVDGDLKRILMKTEKFMEEPVEKFMTINPKVINKDELVARALSIMEGKITSLIVVDRENRPIGLLHIHDILKSRIY